MVVTDDTDAAERMRRFRNHGISADYRARTAKGTWYFEMVDLGYNYRITDIQCALGLSQLDKLRGWVERRREIAGRYDGAFAEVPGIRRLKVSAEVRHACHLYVVELELERLNADRGRVFGELREKGIGVNVHYIPVHLHPYYRERFGTGPGLCPVAEAAYERIISLPIFPKMSDDEVAEVIGVVSEVVRGHASSH